MLGKHRQVVLYSEMIHEKETPTAKCPQRISHSQPGFDVSIFNTTKSLIVFGLGPSKLLLMYNSFNHISFCLLEGSQTWSLTAPYEL